MYFFHEVAARHAVDPANAILNYAFAVLEGQTRQALSAAGFDLACGFLHADRRGHDALVYDLLELVRPPVDDLMRGFLPATSPASRTAPAASIPNWRGRWWRHMACHSYGWRSRRRGCERSCDANPSDVTSHATMRGNGVVLDAAHGDGPLGTPPCLTLPVRAAREIVGNAMRGGRAADTAGTSAAIARMELDARIKQAMS
jgi:hypothetical protein